MSGFNDAFTQKSGTGLFMFFISILAVLMFWEAFRAILLDNANPWIIMGLAMMIVGVIPIILKSMTIGLAWLVWIVLGLITLLFGVVTT